MDGIDEAGIALELVGPANLSAFGIGCVTNPKHVGFAPKVAWLERRFDEGLRYLLFRDAEGKPLAFLEYVPGEYAWRPVEARGWLFVHCLWVYPRGQKVGGLGSGLIDAAVWGGPNAGDTTRSLLRNRTARGRPRYHHRWVWRLRSRNGARVAI